MDYTYDDLFNPWTLVKIISGGTGLIAIGLLIDERKKSIARESDIQELIELLISIYKEENLPTHKKAKINKVIEKINNRSGKKIKKSGRKK